MTSMSYSRALTVVRLAAKRAGLVVRDWSFDKTKPTFALYTPDDSYLGAVTVAPNGEVVPMLGWEKKDKATLDDFRRCFTHESTLS